MYSSIAACAEIDDHQPREAAVKEHKQPMSGFRLVLLMRCTIAGIADLAVRGEGENLGDRIAQADEHVLSAENDGFSFGLMALLLVVVELRYL